MRARKNSNSPAIVVIGEIVKLCALLVDEAPAVEPSAE